MNPSKVRQDCEREERSVGFTSVNMEWRTSIGMLNSDNTSCDMIDHAVLRRQLG